MIEDLHTAYWKSYGWGYRAKRNFFGFVMELLDNMHHWYHAKGLKQAAISKDCSGIHIHDSVLVLEKNKVSKPVHSRIGGIIGGYGATPQVIHVHIENEKRIMPASGSGREPANQRKW